MQKLINLLTLNSGDWCSTHLKDTIRNTSLHYIIGWNMTCFSQSVWLTFPGDQKANNHETSLAKSSFSYSLLFNILPFLWLVHHIIIWRIWKTDIFLPQKCIWGRSSCKWNWEVDMPLLPPHSPAYSFSGNNSIAAYLLSWPTDCPKTINQNNSL